MSLLIHSARLLDPETGLDEMGSVLIEDGHITAMGKEITSQTHAAKTQIDARGLCLAPGLIDLRVKTGEPGQEPRETIASASRAALAGGVTSLVLMPDTVPVIDDVALVQFITNRGGGDGAACRIYPAGGLTHGLKGERMAEIGLMREAGAVFFTNGDRPIQDSGLMRRVMTYAAGHKALVASRPDEPTLSAGGVMHAGELATRMGLKGLPREAEWVGLARDLILAEATGCTLLADCISTGRSLDMIKAARARGVSVFASVAAYSLFFNVLDVGDYLTYCKVSPPFREEDDRQALINGLAAGEIDCVVSAHDPQPPEAKRLPFGEAAFGAIGLETKLSVLLSLVQDERLSLNAALRAVTSLPAKILGLPQGRLQIGAPADLILFDPDKPWLCEREELLSRSTNSPFDSRRLVGRVHKTLVGGQVVYSR